jgi:hypothetical protein
VKTKGIAGLAVPMLTDPKLAGDGAVISTGLTVRGKFVVAVSASEVPVTVIVAVPRVAVLLVVSVSVLVPFVGFGLNDAVTPLGKPDTAKLTLPLKPF